MINVQERTAMSYGAPSVKAAAPGTLADIFLHAAAKFDLPDALNFKENGKWKPISSTTIVSRSENIALGLYSLGVHKGDRVAILAPNSPQWTLCDAGCQFAGFVDVPIYTTLSDDSVRYILDDSRAKILILQDEISYERLLP